MKNKTKKVLGKIKTTAPLMRGSLVRYETTCGKKGCKCSEGKKHSAFYFSRRVGGKTKMHHIGKNQVKDVRAYRKNYERLMFLVEEMTDCLLEELKEAKKR